MKTNIVFISLMDDISKKLGERFSKDFELYFADMNDILEYSLMNEKEIGNICGIDYVNSLKDKIIRNIATYENTLITLPCHLFVSGKNAKLLRQYGTVVFLKFKKEDCKDNIDTSTKIKNITFDDYSKLCEDDCDISIELENLNFEDCYKKIKKVLDEYFL